MKKFISMVMAAAMVVSLVPSTAFAANKASFKVTGAIECKEDDADDYEVKGAIKNEGVQIQITLGDVDTVMGEPDSFDITLDFDNLEAIVGSDAVTNWAEGTVVRGTTGSNAANATTGSVTVGTVDRDAFEADDTSVDFTINELYDENGAGYDFRAGDMIILNIPSQFVLSRTAEGTVGTVTVSGDFGDSEAMPVISVLAEALDLTVAGKVVEVAEEETVWLKKITIESVVGAFDADDEIKIKINNGFEFTKAPAKVTIDEDEIKFFAVDFLDANGDVVFAADTIQVEAVDSKAGDIGTLTATCKGYESDSDEAVEVIADAVIMSVDEDEDVPVMYAGTDEDENGLTSGEDHTALIVTIEETVKDAWDTVDAFTLTLPEGVYVHDMEVKDVNGTVTVNKKATVGTYANDETAAFAKAYADGEFEYFDFGRRAFEVTDNDGDKAELELKMVLIAEPEFEGDVVLTLEGDAFETQEVVIAKFVKAYTVEAAANDLVIDYKETVVPTDVVITEAEEGLWKKGESFTFRVEDIEVEDAVVTVNEDDSDMEIKDDVTSTGANFTVKVDSDDEVGVVTISDMELYMQRNIPAGAYDLDLNASMFDYFTAEGVFGSYDEDGTRLNVADTYYDGDEAYWETVKEGFINVITAGRDQDDASFTKKVVVPVGAMEIVAGEDVVALDVPAYINAAGYTMLPVRAVAVALGINTNNVIWDQATKTVTILYGQRIITMTVGQKVINVNGSAIPASAAVEIVNGRTFLGLRDLATALGVVDITWDAATQTATLNGGNK